MSVSGAFKRLLGMEFNDPIIDAIKKSKFTPTKQKTD